MEKIRIFVEMESEQFREYELNPDADSGKQYIERVYPFSLVVDAVENSQSIDEFNNRIDNEAKTWLYDKGTNEYLAIDADVEENISYTLSKRDPILMLAIASKPGSTCKSCVFFNQCDVIYRREFNNHDCQYDPVSECGNFLPTKILGYKNFNN